MPIVRRWTNWRRDQGLLISPQGSRKGFMCQEVRSPMLSWMIIHCCMDQRHGLKHIVELMFVQQILGRRKENSRLLLILRERVWFQVETVMILLKGNLG